MEVTGFLIAIFLGALIGLQREYDQQRTKIARFAGIRTFILISLLGVLLGYLSQEVFENYFLVFIGFIAVIIFAGLSYYFAYKKYKDTTATTEITAILTFILGVMCATTSIKTAVILGALIAVFITFKQIIHKFATKIKKKELFAVGQFALISLVILPLLPNKEFSPLDIPILKDILLSLGISSSILEQLTVLNPFNIWLMVILVAGISFIGYLLVRFLGTKKGYGLTGFVGGLISSTAVTLSMASESKKQKYIYAPFVLAAIVATSTSFIRVLNEVIVVNNSLIKYLFIPIGLMAVVGFISIFFLFRAKHKDKKAKEIKFEQPFALMPALKFGLFFALVIFVTKLASILAGSLGLYVAGILAGIADVDAIALSMSSLSKLGEITNNVAITTIVLAVASNTIMKAGMAWFFGAKKFAKYLSIISVLILIFGLGSLLFI